MSHPAEMDTVGCDVSSSTTFFATHLSMLVVVLVLPAAWLQNISFNVSRGTRSTFHAMLYCNSIATLVNSFSIDQLIPSV